MPEIIRKPQWAIDRIGLSTDTKGTDAVQGTTFYEQDTGNTYIFLSGSWALKYSPETSVHNKVYDVTLMDWVAEPLVDADHAISVKPGTGESFGITDDELRALPIKVEIVQSVDGDDVETPYDDDDAEALLIKTDSMGRRPSSESMSVALATDQILDYQAPLIDLRTPAVGRILAFQDCLQYRTVALQIITGVGVTTAGVISFEGSNDMAAWSAMTMIDQATPGAAGVTTMTTAASTNRFFMGPVYFRYFRARVSTAVAGGSISALAVYRMAPFVNAVTNASIAMWGGTGVATGGVAGLPAVGGNIAIGVTPTGNPVLVGGVDNTLLAPLTRRFTTDIFGNQRNIGVDSTKYSVTDPVQTHDAYDGLDHMSIYTALDAILWELKLQNSYFKQLPDLLNAFPGSLFEDDVETFKQANTQYGGN
jgi:hypothetical protein